MHIIAGAIMALVGAAAVAYIARGASAFEREPPFLALGLMLVATGIGLCGRSRVAGLLARIGIAASLLLLVRRARGRARFGPIDIVPIAGLAAALVLGTGWLLGSDTELRPCRLGNDLACQQIAARLIESAERSPSTPPTAWEERAARVLDAELCPSSFEPGPCGARRYAVGAVALRGGRTDDAKRAFRQACDFHPNWCARAAQETAVLWTPDEQRRLQRRAQP